MTKLRGMAVLAVLGALFATSAQAQDGAYNTKYGMVFSLQNVFVRSDILSDFQGGVGLQYTLSPTRAIRGSVDLSRASSPPFTSESTNLTTGVVTKTYSHPAAATGYTSQYGIGVGASYIVRLTNAALGPYLGAGGRITYSRNANNWKDDVSSTVVTTSQDKVVAALGLDGVATLGLEWRVQKSISLFAEYGLTLNLIRRTSFTDEQKTVANATGAVSGTKVENTQTRYLNWSTALDQGGSLGVIAFF